MRALCISVAFALLATSAIGQVTTAKLEGSVQDPSGAIIPSAHIATSVP